MSASTGIQIKRNDFSDPQGRIDKPDRLPATPKVHVRVFIKESNDVFLLFTALKMAPMLYVTLMLQLLAFVARTMLNREHLHYRIVAIHCILLLLLLLSRRSRAREK